MNLTFTVNMANMEESNRTLDEVRQLLDMYNNMIRVNASVAEEEGSSSESSSAEGEVPLVMGKGATTVFMEILHQIKTKGEATLEDVSEVCVLSIPTVRAHLMNGLRTYRKHQKEPPFNQSWSPTRSCVVYTAR